jgi:hypothetical protein
MRPRTDRELYLKLAPIARAFSDKQKAQDRSRAFAFHIVETVD